MTKSEETEILYLPDGTTRMVPKTNTGYIVEPTVDPVEYNRKRYRELAEKWRQQEIKRNSENESCD